MTFEEFNKRIEEVKGSPIVKLELTMDNSLLKKYDVIEIGEGFRFIILSEFFRINENEYKYIITPFYNEDSESNNKVNLISTILPEL